MMHNTEKMPWHSGEKSVTFQWWPTDSQERCNEMMQDPIHRAYFQEQGWDKPDGINYHFNKYGFRAQSPDDNFDPQNNNLVALGCSFTMGIGLPYKDVWPTVLATALNLQACNFGWGGGSSDRCFRLAEYWVPYLKPKLVVLLNPPRGRCEVVIDDNTREAEGVVPGVELNFADVFIKKWMSIDENQRLNNLKNSLAIEAICNKLKIPFLSYEADVWMSRSREEAGYARDYFHAGPKGHKSFTERILDDWSKK
jgi:hypothetical protein